MNTITIRNVPPFVHKLLKRRAEDHGRSLNKEILATLQGALQSTRIDGNTIGEHARVVRESMNVYLTQKDLSALKSAGRR